MKFLLMKFTYKILAFGCQMNKNDAERIRHYLNSLEGKEVEKDEEASLFVVVACSVRQQGVDRLFGFVHNWKKYLKQEFTTILTGCVSAGDKKAFAERFDFVLPIDSLSNWGNYLKNTFSALENHEDLENDYFKILPEANRAYSVFVPIMTGCNNFCSYCIVPYVRGRERSRSVEEVLEEIKNLVKNGAKEVTLLGQNVNSYNPADQENYSAENIYTESAFAKLLWEVNQLAGVERIHFTASHPKDMHDEVIDAMTLPKHINFLHLPLQSGSDSVLERMNRKYTVADYKKIIQKVLAKKPDMALGTDLIVGFCGETEAEFQETIETYKDFQFDISYNAKYSNRKGTLADKEMEDNLSLDEKKKRWFALQKLMEEITREKNKKYEGEIVSVLFDNYNVEKKYLTGNSKEMKYVIIKDMEDDALLGEIRDVKIVKTSTWALWGTIVN